MPSFPSVSLQLDEAKVRYLEPFASEALNKRFTGLPLGVYYGFTPSVTGGSDILTLEVDVNLQQSLLRVLSGAEPDAIDVIVDRNIELDFAGHDFGTDPIVYVVAKASYRLGATTTSEIITQNTTPNGQDEIGICKITESGGNLVVSTEINERHLPEANLVTGRGFMPTGSVEDIANLLALSGNFDIDPTIYTDSFSLSVSDMGKLFLVDMIGIAADKNVTLPDAADIEDGSRVTFLSLTGRPSGFNLHLVAGSDSRVEFQGITIPPPSGAPFLFTNRGYMVSFVLSKTASLTSPYPTPTWFCSWANPVLHGAQHRAGSTDEIKLDDFAEPDDNTDLDVSTSRHGLCPKLSGDSTEFLNGLGNYVVPGLADRYDVETIVVTGSATLPGSGKVTAVEHTSGSHTLSLPDSSAAPEGEVTRIYFRADSPSGRTTIQPTTGTDRIVWNGAAVASITSYFFAGQWLEFALSKRGGVERWILSGLTLPDAHNARHHAGAIDALDVKQLDGYPGGGTTFLRDDGTFATVPEDTPQGFFGRSTSGGSPISWNQAFTNDTGFTRFSGDTEIEVPSAGLYLVNVSLQGASGAGISADVRVGGTVINSQSANAGAGGVVSLSLTALINITTPASERVTVQQSNLDFASFDKNVISIVKIKS